MGTQSNHCVINDEGICDTELFNFREWQKYIECRKAVLANAHFPTKLKYNPHIPDLNSLYIKFLETLDSKIDREEPEITTHKHLIPRQLVHAMKQCIANISYSNLPINEVNEFSPSLMPHHSSLQQLLEHPLYDLPSILRNDFSSTKIRYMTKPEFICRLSSDYNMTINIIDSNLHFVEKIVPLFEQSKMASMKDLTDNTIIQDSLQEDIKRKEDFTDYLHRKMSSRVKIDVKKRQYYDNIRNPVKKDLLTSADEFIFNETLPNGKLSIPDINNDENEDDENDTKCLKDIVSEKTALLLSKFCKEYDINLSSIEKRTMFKDLSRTKKVCRRRKLFRNASGKFVKQDHIENDSNKDDFHTEESEITLRENVEIKDILPDISDILSLSTNASIFDELMESEIGCDANDQLENSYKELVIDNTVSTLDKNLNDNTLRLFRPFKDYWMYHCNFSRVKTKNFELFEKTLPRSFRWLLHECASVIEMSAEDLYEEVCLVEAYYAYFSEQSKDMSGVENYKTYINRIVKKW